MNMALSSQHVESKLRTTKLKLKNSMGKKRARLMHWSSIVFIMSKVCLVLKNMRYQKSVNWVKMAIQMSDNEMYYRKKMVLSIFLKFCPYVC